MPPPYYLDTSVFGSVFDDGFEIESSQILEMVKSGQITCVLSAVTEGELVHAPERVRSIILGLDSSCIERIGSTTESIILADTYISENVVGPASYNDCLHIAAATVHNVDVLVSWNFKHIVNVQRIRNYNCINLRLGCNELDIVSPKAILHYENERKSKQRL